MNAIFVDTYFYLALVSEKDAGHERAVTASSAWRGRTIITAWILTEVADALADPEQRSVFVRLLSTLRADPKLTIVPPTQKSFDRGVTLYKERHDKGWSLTDCISFGVMQDHNLTQALTADHHFEQAGFIILMKQ